MEVESLLRLADWARRCRILSTELKLRAAGDVKCLANVGESALLSVVGVGGVTSVAGGSWRFCGVAGRAVLSGSCFGFGVAGVPCLLLPFASSLGGTEEGASDLFEGCVSTLFLLLDVLNMPPKPPPPPPPSTLVGSVSPPDFLRGSVQALRSLPLGDELRSGSATLGSLFALGSTMWGIWRSMGGKSAAGPAFVGARTSATGRTELV